MVNPSATLVWAPAGIALAAMLLLGKRMWPAILVGAFLVNLTTPGSVVTAVVIAIGNTLEAVVGATLVERFAGGRLFGSVRTQNMSRLSRLVYLIFGHSTIAVELIQILLGGLSCVLVYLIAKVYLPRLAAALAAAFYGLYFVAVATDVTMEELAAIFSTAKKWSDVRPEWPAEDILRFTPGTDSGTFDYFVEAVLAPAIAREYAISSTYPHPGDDAVTVEYVIGKEGRCALDLIDMSGETLRSIVSDIRLSPGRYRAAFRTDGLPSGMFLIRLSPETGPPVYHKLIVRR